MEYIRFHFVMDKSLFDEIHQKAFVAKLSISDFISFILTETYSLIEKYDCKLLGLNSSDFRDGKFDKSSDLFVKIPQKYKRILFVIQDHFSLRSKGFLLRFIIKWYFYMVEKHGGDVIKKFLGVEKIRWEKEKGAGKSWIKTHMCFLPPYFSTTYDKNNELLEIKFVSS